MYVLCTLPPLLNIQLILLQILTYFQSWEQSWFNLYLTFNPSVMIMGDTNATLLT